MNRVTNRAMATSKPAKSVSTFRNTLIVSGGTLFSRLLGFLRLAITIYVLSKTINDVFQLSRALPNQVYDLFLSSAFSAILIPSFVKVDKREDRDNFITALFLVAMIAMLVVTILAMIGAPLLVSLFGYSIPANWRSVVIVLSLWCMPQIFFLGLHSILGQYLNAQNRFVGYAWSPALNNVVAIAGLLLFNQLYNKHSAAGRALEDPAVWTSEPMILLAGLTTLGVAIQALVLVVPAYRAGLRFVRPIQIRGLGLGKTVKEGSWAISIVIIGQLATVATSNVAAAAFAWTQKTGKVVPSYVEQNVAILFYILPYSLFALALVNVLFPQMSKAVVKKQDDRVRQIYARYQSIMTPILVFSALYLILASIPLAQSLTFFSNYDPYLVALIIAGLAPNVVPLSACTMLQRLLFANGQARSVFMASIPITTVIVALSYLSVKIFPAEYWLFAGVLALTVGNIVFWVCLTYYLPSGQKIGWKAELYLLGRPLFGALVTAILLLIPLSYFGFMSSGILQILIRLLTIGIGGAVLFAYLGVNKTNRAAIFDLLRHKLSR